MLRLLSNRAIVSSKSPRATLPALAPAPLGFFLREFNLSHSLYAKKKASTKAESVEKGSPRLNLKMYQKYLSGEAGTEDDGNGKKSSRKRKALSDDEDDNEDDNSEFFSSKFNSPKARFTPLSKTKTKSETGKEDNKNDKLKKRKYFVKDNSSRAKSKRENFDDDLDSDEEPSTSGSPTSYGLQFDSKGEIKSSYVSRAKDKKGDKKSSGEEKKSISKGLEKEKRGKGVKSQKEKDVTTKSLQKQKKRNEVDDEDDEDGYADEDVDLYDGDDHRGKGQKKEKRSPKASSSSPSMRKHTRDENIEEEMEDLNDEKKVSKKLSSRKKKTKVEEVEEEEEGVEADEENDANDEPRPRLKHPEKSRYGDAFVFEGGKKIKKSEIVYPKKTSTSKSTDKPEDPDTVTLKFRPPLDYDAGLAFDKILFGDYVDMRTGALKSEEKALLKKLKEKDQERAREKGNATIAAASSEKPEPLEEPIVARPTENPSEQEVLPTSEEKPFKIEEEPLPKDLSQQEVEGPAEEEEEAKQIQVTPVRLPVPKNLDESGTIKLRTYLIAQSGLGTRNQVSEYLTSGRILVNGEVVTNFAHPLTKVDRIEVLPRTDVKFVAYAFNKPVGLLSSPNGDEDWALNWLPKDLEGWNVGRLDRDSSGLIIFTNDGWLSGQIITENVPKEYRVVTAMAMSDDQLKRLSQGVNVLGEKTKPARVERLSANSFIITLEEGRNRQIRRMVRAVQGEVVSLHRYKIGGFTLPEGVKPGYYKELTRDEVEMALGSPLPLAVAAGYKNSRLKPWKPSTEIHKIPELLVQHEEARKKKSYYERRKEALTWQKLQQEKEQRRQEKIARRKARLAAKAKQ